MTQTTLTRPRAHESASQAKQPQTPALEVNKISKSFGKNRVLTDFSMKIMPGEVMALLGPNGAGKTTALDIALGLQDADQGSASLFGMSSRKAVSMGLVGVVQQTDALLTEVSVRRLLNLVAATMRDNQSVDEVMEAAGITHLAKRKVGKLSGGERQRVRLAIGLLPDPLLLILDEPTTGMDVRARSEFWDFIEAQAETGRAVLFATHYLTEAQQYAKRTLIMSEDRVLADEATDELRRKYAGAHLTIKYEGEDAVAFDQMAQARGKRDWSIIADAGRVLVRGHDLDDAARAALNLPGAHNLELRQSTVEEAYLKLVGEHK